jgi:hypothetical protein
MKHAFQVYPALLLFAAAARPAPAQQYAIPWFKIAGGGATAPSTGGVYALSGTIGQVDSGRVASTNYSYRLEAGFWAIAIQQLGYPSLNITQSSTNTVVSWVTAESGLILQSATDLATPTAWTDTGLSVATNATTNLVTVPLNPTQRAFFRLRRP